MYTIPHLLTVAGLATKRSSTSNIIVMNLERVKISPEFKHNFLLSSSALCSYFRSIKNLLVRQTPPSGKLHFDHWRLVSL